MVEKYTIITENLGNKRTMSRMQREVVGQDGTECEMNPKELHQDYKKAYRKITKAHNLLIKSTNLERVLTTFHI